MTEFSFNTLPLTNINVLEGTAIMKKLQNNIPKQILQKNIQKA